MATGAGCWMTGADVEHSCDACAETGGEERLDMELSVAQLVGGICTVIYSLLAKDEKECAGAKSAYVFFDDCGCLWVSSCTESAGVKLTVVQENSSNKLPNTGLIGVKGFASWGALWLGNVTLVISPPKSGAEMERLCPKRQGDGSFGDRYDSVPLGKPYASD